MAVVINVQDVPAGVPGSVAVAMEGAAGVPVSDNWAEFVPIGTLSCKIRPNSGVEYYVECDR